MEISIVIPVCEAQKSIGKVIDELQALPYLQQNQWELILVDDFSSDKSFEIIQAKAKEYPNIIGITLHKNAGQHAATFVGIREAKGKYLLTMDDDGEHPVSQIAPMIQKLEENKVDVVYASPTKREKSRFRKVVSKGFKISARMFSDGYGDGSAFRLIHRSVYSQIQKLKTPFVFIDEILAWYTKNVYFF
ncbi:MAG: glycosyltransferase [Flavobacteriales bacterium]|nr:glycosyltransferase [Flavobacteriales bacterium]